MWVLTKWTRSRENFTSPPPPQIRAEPCSGLSCRWLAQNGEWAFPLVTGLLCVLTFFSLVSLNFSDPGILHQGEALVPGRRM